MHSAIVIMLEKFSFKMGKTNNNEIKKGKTLQVIFFIEKIILTKKKVFIFAFEYKYIVLKKWD